MLKIMLAPSCSLQLEDELEQIYPELSRNLHKEDMNDEDEDEVEDPDNPDNADSLVDPDDYELPGAYEDEYPPHETEGYGRRYGRRGRRGRRGYGGYHRRRYGRRGRRGYGGHGRRYRYVRNTREEMNIVSHCREVMDFFISHFNVLALRCPFFCHRRGYGRGRGGY